MGNSDVDFGPRGWQSNGDWQVKTIAASGAAQTLDASDITDMTLTSTTAITAPPAKLGQVIRLILRQDGTGTRIPTWVGVKWAAGTAPTLSTPASSIDLVRLECLDGVNWYGSLTGKAYA